MVVFRNRRLAEAPELRLPADRAGAVLRAVRDAAAAAAAARWEQELAAWLGQRAEDPRPSLDVAEIAWTPEHFPAQRAFALAAVRAAAVPPALAEARDGLAELVAAHPREAVAVGRRWRWATDARSPAI